LTVRGGDAIKAGSVISSGGAVAQLGARLDGIEEVRGSNPLGSTNSPTARIAYSLIVSNGNSSQIEKKIETGRRNPFRMLALCLK
jgi:hypothetical protein